MEIESSKNLPNVVRVKHDKEHPFLMLNKQAIRDPNLSLEAVGLLTRLLCNKDDWTIHVTQLMTANNCGRDKMYRILKELVTNGYAYHAIERTKGKYQPATWYVFENKKSPEEIKEMFPFTENPYTAKPNTANPPLMIPNSNDNNNKENNTYAPPIGDAKKISSSSLSAKPQKKKRNSYERWKNAKLIERVSPKFQASEDYKNFCQEYSILVGTSDEQHQILIDTYGEAFLTKMYNFLANWKLSKAESSPREVEAHADYFRLTGWVARAVKKEVLENQNSPSTYKRSGKLAIESDKIAMEKLKETGSKWMTADELSKHFYETDPDVKKFVDEMNKAEENGK